jgi:hypothetical protein
MQFDIKYFNKNTKEYRKMVKISYTTYLQNKLLHNMLCLYNTMPQTQCVDTIKYITKYTNYKPRN